MQAHQFTAWSCVLGFGAALAGCASPVARRPAALNVGEQGGAWEVVLPPTQTAVAMDWESTRRDEALSFRDETAFSDADKPSLDDIEYLYLPHRADVLMYYSTDGSGRGGYGWGGDAYGWRRGVYGWGRGAYRGRW